MIDDMITRLLNEANEEADHKAWCDTEMATNKHTREKKTEEVRDRCREKVFFVTSFGIGDLYWQCQYRRFIQNVAFSIRFGIR